MNKKNPEVSLEQVVSVEEGEPAVAILYDRLPFCNPEELRGSSQEVIYNFDPQAGAKHGVLRAEAANLYEIEKSGRMYGENNDGGGLDLYDRDHAKGLAHHVLVHSATGMLRWGTSDTPNIPYWDREFAVEALRLQHSDGEQKVAMLDALNINYLRTFNRYLIDKISELTMDKNTLESALEKGQRTRNDISPKQMGELDIVQKEHEIILGLTCAKLKHLIWLTDQQKDPEVRHYLLPEIMKLIEEGEDAGILTGMLGVDMGVDTGISQATYRPAYVITGFKQLQHLGSDTYALPQQMCHQLSLADLLKSINRQDDDMPSYDDGRYKLPWKL